MDDFRNNAKQLYGCRGIFIPAGTTPGIGVPNQIVPVIMNWTGAAGWLAKHYYDYYLFTGDQSFLKKKALPFMREAALFYEDFLVVGEDGFYKFYPSVSPENTPENFMPKGGEPLAHPMPTTVNATADFAIMKELFTNLIDGSLTIGESLQKIEEWKQILERIPPYQSMEMARFENGCTQNLTIGITIVICLIFIRFFQVRNLQEKNNQGYLRHSKQR